ncbi:unnamed protein product, partial [Chrysoparadoxa australica]
MVTPAKAKQARRRYRALFQIGFSEYAAWLESEREVEKVLSSLDNVAWRTALVNGPVQTLGVLPQIPGAVDMMKKVHLRELERLMKQLKALISQLREQADRVAGAAHELSDLHYAEGAAVLQLDLQEGTRIGGPDPTQYFHWISSLRAALGLEMYRKVLQLKNPTANALVDQDLLKPASSIHAVSTYSHCSLIFQCLCRDVWWRVWGLVQMLRRQGQGK